MTSYSPGLDSITSAIAAKLENVAGTIINPATEDTLRLIPGFSIAQYDFVDVTYTDSTQANISTVVFKTGGSGGTTVATITANYVSGTETTYTKT